MRLIYFSIALLLLFLSSCSDDKPKEIINIPDIYSYLLMDNTAEYIKKFNSLGSYSTASYFENFSNQSANITALMSGKKTLNGSIGLDKDSTILKTWLDDFKKENYHISIITDGSLGDKSLGPIFPGTFSKYPPEEEIAKNLVRHKPDFIWGMGTNLFKRRKDGLNLFEELSTNGYKINMDITKINLNKEDAYAGVFYNWSKPDTINLIEKGIKEWGSIKSKEKRGFVLMVLFNEMEELLSSKSLDKLYSFNNTLDMIMKSNELNQSNTLVLIINPFQDFQRTFQVNKSDTLIFSSQAQSFNHLNNSIWAFGKNSIQFTGNYANTDVYRMIKGLKKN